MIFLSTRNQYQHNSPENIVTNSAHRKLREGLNLKFISKKQKFCKKIHAWREHFFIQPSFDEMEGLGEGVFRCLGILFPGCTIGKNSQVLRECTSDILNPTNSLVQSTWFINWIPFHQNSSTFCLSINIEL